MENAALGVVAEMNGRRVPEHARPGRPLAQGPRPPAGLLRGHLLRRTGGVDVSTDGAARRSPTAQLVRPRPLLERRPPRARRRCGARPRDRGRRATGDDQLIPGVQIYLDPGAAEERRGRSTTRSAMRSSPASSPRATRCHRHENWPPNSACRDTRSRRRTACSSPRDTWRGGRRWHGGDPDRDEVGGHPTVARCSARRDRVGTADRGAPAPGGVDLRGGQPDPRCSRPPSGGGVRRRRCTDRSPATASPPGSSRCGQVLAGWIGRSRGVIVDADQILVTSGAQEAVHLVVRTMLRPGDPIAVEDPGYPPVRLLFEAIGLRVVAVPVDGEGSSSIGSRRT